MGTCNSVARVGDVFFIPLSAMVIMIAAITVTKLIVPMQDVSFYSHVLFVLSFFDSWHVHTKNATDLSQVLNFTRLQQTRQLHQVATSLLKTGLLQLVVCRLVTIC